jgi:hypothetical protein
MNQLLELDPQMDTSSLNENNILEKQTPSFGPYLPIIRQYTGTG